MEHRMKVGIRRKLDTALRVRDFCWSHPCSNTAYIAAIDRLAERIVRAQTLIQVRDAGAELGAVTGEIMGLVVQIDAINRFRFRNDAHMLSAWHSSRNCPWPAGDEHGAQPESGSIKPAA
jgi:hypothetical protein